MMEGLDLASVAVDPAKMAGGVHWRIWRADDGAIAGKPIDGPEAGPWLLIVPRGIALDRALRDEETPHRDKIREGKVDEAERLAMTWRAHGRATLRGWGNLSLRGQDVPYSEAMAVELMTAPQWAAVREFVLVAYGHLAAAQVREVQGAAGK